MTRSEALRNYADALNHAHERFIREHIAACPCELLERIDLSHPCEMLAVVVRGREFSARDDESEQSKVVVFPRQQRAL